MPTFWKFPNVGSVAALVVVALLIVFILQLDHRMTYLCALLAVSVTVFAVLEISAIRILLVALAFAAVASAPVWLPVMFGLVAGSLPLAGAWWLSEQMLKSSRKKETNNV